MRNLIKSILVAGTVALFSLSPAHAQTAPLKWLTTASTNATLVFASKALLGTGIVVNTTTTVYYLKLYDKATTPVCGTDVPKWTIPIPSSVSSSPGGFPMPLGQGLTFANGVGFCVTGGIADNDTTPAAAGIAINLGVSGR